LILHDLPCDRFDGTGNFLNRRGDSHRAG
jgi:hypothetical protein